MKRIHWLITFVALSTLVVGSALQAGTILDGLNSTSASGTTVAGTIDTGYVTAVFGTNAVFVQDSTGGIYVPYGAIATSGLSGATVGTQITGISGGGFEYYSPYNVFEYYAGKSTSNLTVTGSTPGMPGSIPLSYYTFSTVAGVLGNQGSSDGGSPATVAPGFQNQLLTLNNVTIQTSTGDPVSGNFAAGRYRIVDASSSSYLTLYINSGVTDVIGTPIPTGPVNLSGVFYEYNSTTQEIEPRGMYDFASPTAAPEPSSFLIGGLAIVGGGILRARRRRT